MPQLRFVLHLWISFSLCVFSPLLSASADDADHMPEDMSETMPEGMHHDMMQMADHSGHHMHDPYHLMMPSECPENAHWEATMGMCMTSHLGSDAFDWHVHGQIFALETVEQGPRGRSALSAPDMLMGDLGHDFGIH